VSIVDLDQASVAADTVLLRLKNRRIVRVMSKA